MSTGDVSPDEVGIEAFYVRTGSPADIGAMALLQERANAFRDGRTLPKDITGQGALERIQARMDMLRSWAHIAMDVDGDRMVGFVLGHPSVGEETLEATEQSGPKVEYLALLMTEPDFWGNGIGTELLDVAADTARKLGKDRMILWTSRTNDRSRRLYERQGYLQTSRTRVSEIRGPQVQYALDL